jgi:hypothetical protein
VGGRHSWSRLIASMTKFFSDWRQVFPSVREGGGVIDFSCLSNTLEQSDAQYAPYRK